MQNTTPLLSICIPTFNRSAYLKNTLESITNEDIFQNSNLVEIVISDNNSSDDTEKICLDFINRFNEKITYKKNEKNIEDKNIEQSLRLGLGDYLKLNNDTLMWKPGSLDKVIRIIQAAKKRKPILFFLNNCKETLNPGSLANNLSEFIKIASYFSTWIGAFGIWKEHFHQIKNFSRNSELLLPQVDVLFRLIDSGMTTLIDNSNHFSVQDVGPKGGYNIAKVFGKNYMSIINDFKSRIEPQVIEEEKKLILLNHIIPFHFSVHHDFYQPNYLGYLSDFANEDYFQAAIRSAEHLRAINLMKLEGKSITEIWRILNSHNQTYILNDHAEIHKFSVGRMSYGVLNIQSWDNPEERLIIGHFVSIANGVNFLLGGNHPYKGFL